MCLFTINVMRSLLFFLIINCIPSLVNAMEGDPLIYMEQNNILQQPIPLTVFKKMIKYGIFPSAILLTASNALQGYNIYAQHTPLEEIKSLQIGAFGLSAIALIFAYKALYHSEKLQYSEE